MNKQSIKNAIKLLAANYGSDPLFSVAIFVLEVKTKAQVFISSSEGRVGDKWLENVCDVYQKAKLLYILSRSIQMIIRDYRASYNSWDSRVDHPQSLMWGTTIKSAGSDLGFLNANNHINR